MPKKEGRSRFRWLRWRTFCTCPEYGQHGDKVWWAGVHCSDRCIPQFLLRSAILSVVFIDRAGQGHSSKPAVLLRCTEEIWLARPTIYRVRRHLHWHKCMTVALEPSANPRGPSLDNLGAKYTKSDWLHVEIMHEKKLWSAVQNSEVQIKWFRLGSGQTNRKTHSSYNFGCLGVIDRNLPSES